MTVSSVMVSKLAGKDGCLLEFHVLAEIVSC